jgi:hypothetical protein
MTKPIYYDYAVRVSGKQDTVTVTATSWKEARKIACATYGVIRSVKLIGVASDSCGR